MRSSLSKARAVGSARGGTRHMIEQRFSAIVLFLLTPWMIIWFAPAFLSASDSLEVVAWLNLGANSLLLATFLLAGIWHGKLGFQVVIEDYIHGETLKISALIALNIVWLGSSLALLFAMFANN